jgi:phosphoribosylglycinamide formyltransferase-1
MMAREKLRLAVLISGGGSNMAAIARACMQNQIDARIVHVIADRGTAGGIELAKSLGLPTTLVESVRYQGREDHERAIAATIEQSDAQLLLLAGYMRILSTTFVSTYLGRLLNIHPSLLPKYKGLHTHRRVLEGGEREHGASVHFVSSELDGGPIICQARVPVLPGDTEQTLAARVLTREHKIYPKVVGLVAAGRVQLSGDRVLFDGRPLAAPLSDDDSPVTTQPHHVQ